MSHTTEKKERKSDPNTDSLYMDGNRAEENNNKILVNRFADGHREREPMKGGAKTSPGPRPSNLFASLATGWGGGASRRSRNETLSVRPSLLLSGSHTAREHIRLPSIASSLEYCQRLHRSLPGDRSTGLPGNTIRYTKVPVETSTSPFTDYHVLYTCVYMDPLTALRQQAARRALAAAGIVPPNASSDVGKDEAPLVAASHLVSAASDLETAARELFNKYDKDKTGEISRKDFEAARASLAQDRQRDIGSFRETDRDHSGTISWGEFAICGILDQYEATHATVHNEAARLKTAVSAAASCHQSWRERAFWGRRRSPRPIVFPKPCKPHNHQLIQQSSAPEFWLDRPV